MPTNVLVQTKKEHRQWSREAAELGVLNWGGGGGGGQSRPKIGRHNICHVVPMARRQSDVWGSNSCIVQRPATKYQTSGQDVAVGDVGRYLCTQVPDWY